MTIDTRVGFMVTSIIEKELREYIDTYTIKTNNKLKYVGEISYLKSYILIKQ